MGRPQSLTAQSEKLRIEVWKTVLEVCYVQLTPRQATIEDIRFPDGRPALTDRPTDRYRNLISRTFRAATGLHLMGLKQYTEEVAS